MQINMIRSDKVYQEMLELPLEKREGCFRAKILAPFATKYQTQHIPLKAKYPGGFDALFLLGFMNQLPSTLSEKDRPAIDSLSSDQLWQDCQDTIKRSIGLFEQAGYDLDVEDYHLLFYWAIQKNLCYSSIRVTAEMEEFQATSCLVCYQMTILCPVYRRRWLTSAITMSVSNLSNGISRRH